MNDPTCPYIVQLCTTLTPVIVPDHLETEPSSYSLVTFTSPFLTGPTES